jgi:uncharacterized protein (DUF4213/DUF364 family)
MDSKLVQSLLEDLNDPDAVVESLHVFRHWVFARITGGCGVVCIPAPMTSTLCRGNTDLSDWRGRPVKEVVESGFADPEVVHRAAAMACLNAGIHTPKRPQYGDAILHMSERIKQEPSCFIGRFDTGVKWRAKGYPVTIVELKPREGDIHWNDADRPLREAAIVFITGLTLLNGTFRAVVERTPNADVRVLVGPTVPVSPRLFDHGVQVIGGTTVCDADQLIAYLQYGGTSMKRAPSGAVQRFNIVAPGVGKEVSHVA